jgi:RNA polymerase sigma-70 factor (ECF subfamily)
MGEHDGILLDRWESTGDQQAFMELVTRYQGMVFGVCVRIVKDQAKAEDLVQECFLKLTKNRPKNVLALGPWLHRIATNTSINQLDSDSRRRNREKKYMEGISASGPATWEDVSEIIDDAVQQLPTDNQEVIVAHFFEGLTQVEVAERLNVPRTTVRSRMKSGLDQLHRKLKSRGLIVPVSSLASMMATPLAQAAPTTLAAAMGKAVLAGVFDPKKAVVPTFSKFLLTGAVALLVGGAAFTALIKADEDEVEVMQAAGSPMAFSTAEPESLPVSLTAKQEVEEETPLDAQLLLVEHEPIEPVSEDNLIRLRCVDESGEPVPGAEVYVCQVARPRATLSWGTNENEYPHFHEGPLTSDAEGYVEFEKVPPDSNSDAIPYCGVYAVLPDRLVGAWSQGGNGGFRQPPPKPFIHMVPSRSIPGQVKLPKGYTLSTVQVNTTSLHAPGANSTYGSFSHFADDTAFGPLQVPLEAQGRFLIRNVPTKGGGSIHVRGQGLGEYRKAVYHGDPVDFIEFDLKPEGFIEGYVHFEDSGARVTGRKVTCYTQTDERTVIPRFGRTDDSGKYRIDGLIEGEYSINVAMENSPPKGITVAKSGIQVKAGQTTGGIDFVVQKGAIVRGRIINDETNEPVDNMLIRANHPADERSNVNSALSDENGYYEIRLPIGESSLHVDTVNFGDNFFQSSPRNAIVNADGPTDSVDFKLEKVDRTKWVKPKGKATITGRVYDSSKQPIEGALVNNEMKIVMVQDGVPEKRGAFHNEFGESPGKTDREGRFSFDVPTNVEHQIIVGGMEWSAYRTVEFNIADGETLDIGEIELKPLEEILFVKLVDQHGEPAADAYYRVEAHRYVQPYGHLQSDSEGMIHLKNLPDTQVKITLSDGRFERRTWRVMPGRYAELPVKRKEQTSNQ